MNLFQSEWLREPPRPAATSYAQPRYGVRYADPTATSADERADDIVDMRPVVTVPTPPRRRPVASFDRAA